MLLSGDSASSCAGLSLLRILLQVRYSIAVRLRSDCPSCERAKLHTVTVRKIEINRQGHSITALSKWVSLGDRNKIFGGPKCDF